MSEDEGGPAGGEGSDPPPAKGNSDRDPGRIAGDPAAKGGEAPDDDPAPIDLDAVRDRAS